MSAAEPYRVLIAGGGVAALEAVLTLQEVADTRLQIVLLSASADFEYGPLSVAEPFGLGRAHRFELAELLDGRDVEIVVDSLGELDANRRRVKTDGGLTLAYDALLIAVGARKRSAVPGAVTYSGARAGSDLGRLLREAEAGRLDRVAFAVPGGVSWSLPAYELALMTSSHFAERGIGAEVVLVTPEPRPVEVFGRRASGVVEEMLCLRGIPFHTATPVRAEPGRLVVEGGESIPADAVVALPRLDAPRIGGLPEGENGFVPVDEHGRVPDLPGVYAAGDVTNSPLKQGGLAAQQADAAAEAIAADLGDPLKPRPFRPVLRGLLLTGRAPRYLRSEVTGGRPARSQVDEDALWWPPAKIMGRRLGPLLALHGAPGSAPPGAVALELDATEENGSQAEDR